MRRVGPSPADWTQPTTIDFMILKIIIQERLVFQLKVILKYTVLEPSTLTWPLDRVSSVAYPSSGAKTITAG